MKVKRVKDDQFPIQIAHNGGALSLTEQCARKLLRDLSKILTQEQQERR